MTTLLKISLTIAAMLATIPYLHAQKCRVHYTTSQSGNATYKDVYEYDYVTEKPSFPGGSSKLIRFINNTREYPSTAYNRGIQGRVTLSFIVNTDGSISNISILKGVEDSLNREAIRIIEKMPHWNPGRLNGRSVPVRVIQTVAFRK